MASAKNGSFPICNSGIGDRIGIVADLYGTKGEAASTAGVSPISLRRYIAEEQAPPFEVLANLAMAKGVSLEWLATGEGELYARQRVVHGEVKASEDDAVEMVKLSVQALEEWLLEENLELDPERKAEVVVVLYRYLRSRNTVNPQEIASLLQALAA